MRRLILLFSIILFTSIGYSQQPTPVLVVWKVDNQPVALRKALYGVDVSKQLVINVYFNKSEISRYKDLKLEFRWYYYLSTRKKLVQTDVVTMDETVEAANNAVVFSSKLTTVQPGWWEVQIIPSTTRQPLRFANRDKFQIYVKRKLYAFR